MEKQLEIIKLLTEAILEKTGISGTVEVSEGDDCPQFVIRTNEAGLLIGEAGQHLIAFNHLLRKLADSQFKKNNFERIQFVLDVNDYQARKNEELKNLARMGAQRARYFKKEVSMEPMSAYDRRIVHAALTEYPDIETASVGQDPNRKVIIKLYEIAQD